uniref:Uncharacterized protein n=1 Tax=Anguilla anguilla TaxID=7936 RepID=A0A0E9QTX5_ANGAN
MLRRLSQDFTVCESLF